MPVGGLLLGLLFASGCGDCPGGECTVDLGSFHVVEPAGPATGDAVFYLHGAGGSAANSAEDPAIVDAFVAAGGVVVIPQGEGGSWGVANQSWGRRDEVVFHDQILAYVQDRVAEPADGDCERWTCDGALLERCIEGHGHRRPSGWAADVVARFSL